MASPWSILPLAHLTGGELGLLALVFVAGALAAWLVKGLVLARASGGRARHDRR